MCFHKFFLGIKNIKKKGMKFTLDDSVREVLMSHGATALTRMLSFAHSQAKFFTSELIPPKKEKK